MTEPLDDAFGVPRLQFRFGQRRRIAAVDSPDQLKTPSRLQQAHAARCRDEFTNAFVAQHARHQHERDRFRRFGGERKLVQVDARTADQMRQLLGNHRVLDEGSADLPCSGK